MKKKLIWIILACVVYVGAGCQEKKEPVSQSGKKVISTEEENNQSIDKDGEIIIEPDIERSGMGRF